MKLKDILSSLRLGVLAGALIALGGGINLQLSSMGHPILGGIFFSFGLMCVCLLGAKLFTGKVGYVLEKDKWYLLDVFIMMIGNVIGAMAVGYLCGAVFKDWTVSTATKFVYGAESSFILSFLRSIGAGVFVYLAVECFRKVDHTVGKLLMIALSIGTMVLTGCNHSIANVFYFAYAQIRVANFDFLCAIVSIIVAMIGNALGSIIVYLLQNSLPFFNKERETNK